jgi:hypothetical protein
VYKTDQKQDAALFVSQTGAIPQTKRNLKNILLRINNDDKAFSLSLFAAYLYSKKARVRGWPPGRALFSFQFEFSQKKGPHRCER